MHIIPVIDLMHGKVVQAVEGQRQHYQPIRSQLTSSHQLRDVVDAILQVYAFDCLYVADLNAITRDTTLPDHRLLIADAIKSYPEIEWWVDAGLRNQNDLQPWLDVGVTPIIASESVADMSTYQRLRMLAPNSVLSLDFFSDGFRGPVELQKKPAYWSQPTLVMSLAKVGAQAGPDIERLVEIQQRHPQQRLYAAGGVRGQHDLHALQQAGIEGVLIASALHQKKIFASE